ncbi:ABC-type sugar transport system, periplasmic component [Lachnospiraceae bacterium JC7]|nr:ABC-type sugar transport system, periplasmic component [Lachnospiraceae bacterium JC7]
MRKSFLVLLILGIMTASSGCGVNDISEPETDGEIKIGVTVYDQYDTFISSILEDLNEDVLKARNETGRGIVLETYNSAQSQATQDDQVEEMIKDGCDVICVNLVDRTAPSNIIDTARNADVPIVFFNRELVDEDMHRWDKLYYVGADAFLSGIMQGELAVDVIREKNVDKNGDGEIQYVMLEGEAGHQDAIVRSENCVNRMLELGVKLDKLGYAIANWNRAQAATQMEKMIKNYGPEIEFVFANNDDMALGAIDAYNASGMNRGSWPYIIGIDGTDPGLSAVKDGTMAATVYNDAKGQAEAIFQLAYRLSCGESLSGLELQGDKYIRLPYQKITQENVDKFR